MAPWNQPRPRHPSWKEILQMEREKDANKTNEELMNQVKELLHESAKDQALTDEEVLEEHTYEEIFQEDHDEEDTDETYDEDEVSALPLDEEIHTSAPQEDNMISYNPFENFDDALFHDCGNEEKYQKDIDEVSLAEGLKKTLLSAFPFQENEVIQSCEEVISPYDVDEFME
jgi:hypothetical protein